MAEHSYQPRRCEKCGEIISEPHTLCEACKPKPLTGTFEIVDEVCTCGHLKSHHGDRAGGLAPGHGACEDCEACAPIGTECIRWVPLRMVLSHRKEGI